MQTPEKDFLAGTTTSTLRLQQHGPERRPGLKRHASGSVPRVSPRLPFQLAVNLQVPPRVPYPSATFHPLLPPSTPAPLGENGPLLPGSPLHPGFICSQFTWLACMAKFNLLSLHAQKRSKNKTGSCCLHFESTVSDTELQKNSPGTVQTREKMLFAVNCLNSIDYPTLVPI